MLRRDFLIDLSRAAALCAVVPNAWRVTTRPRLADDPFTLGVASGDPTPDGGVLWTRLAPRPLEPDGGMDGVRAVVTWEVAADERFSPIVKTGRATASLELGYSVHVDLSGLQPDRWYAYRFRTGDAVSPVGRFRTAPAAGSASALRLVATSCQHWESGLFTAYAHMAREEMDLVTHLGDYIYEYAGQDGGGRVRRHAGLECRTLDDYRRRYAQYKTDPALQAAHARAPWLVTWDDHEVDNNYAGTFGEAGMESEEQMRQRRAAGYQAWWEHMPVRVPRARSWADLSISRRLDWGTTASVHVLDTRQYRSDQACGDGTRAVPCGEWAAPARTLLGAPQERWLDEGLAGSRAAWQVLAQQVMVGEYDNAPGPERQLSMDQWSGYPAARDRLMRSLARHAPNRSVVLTGDIHSSWVHDLRASYDRPDRPVVAAEFVSTSISSGGDGGDRASWVTSAALAQLPDVKWHDGRRGYTLHTVSTDRWTAECRNLPYVTRPDAPLATPTRWSVTRGRAGVTRL